MKPNFKGRMKQERGITLIALVITIIVLLILAGISIATLTGENGILTQAQNAKIKNTKSQAEEEVKLAVGTLQIEEKQKGDMKQEEKKELLEDELKKEQENTTVTINGTGFLVSHRGYEFEIDGKYKVSEKVPFSAEEWDKKAAPEDVFIWQSNDQNDEGYGTVVGYTANVDNYPTLRYPSRCTKIICDDSYIVSTEDITQAQIRSYTQNVKEIELPETVVELGTYAFGTNGTNRGYKFTSIEKINIPNSVITIGDSIFSNCTNLIDINFTENIADIDYNIFDDTAWYANQPDGLIYIGKSLYKYKGTMSDETTIEIKEGTRVISAHAFYKCTELVRITIPDSVITVGESAFSYCTNLTSIIIPESVAIIKESAFSYCTNLASIIIPKGVIKIGNAAFYGNTNLNDITILDDVISIGNEPTAFGNISDVAHFNVLQGSYAETWLQANKLSTQTIEYLTQ